ncbi:MAG: ribosome silencing factor [Gammaproteobacteria bacterium]|nr:ribosome silencing factor [Gammaproteobacteria bacterium]|tara:strand:- start:1118 stop:1447 length:330 start_codon:yes stop_codon:yes gene_type:complete
MIASKIRDLVFSSLDELKALDPVSINVKKISSFTDYMMIATGNSNRHIQALSEKVLSNLKENKINLLGIEGRGEEGWILIDVGDVVLNLMSDRKRNFYDLESLWDSDLQ